jgi:hypothetical protein
MILSAQIERRMRYLSGIGSEWFEYFSGLQPVGRFHPPSLKNPQKVKLPPSPQDGWHRGDSKQARARAKQDMAEIHRRLRRQIGKPEISEVASYPLFPDFSRWL